jgi:hypothetical protein
MNMKPLMPTTPVRARRLLSRGKARAYRNKLGIFCIILKREVEPDNQQIALGIDPGSHYEGYSVVGTQDTILNGMAETPRHVKDAVEQRRVMRHARRGRNCRRRPARFNNRLRNKKTLPPSTYARWNAKLRILKQLLKIIPISDVVVEDVRAVSKKGRKKWNSNFSPIEVGKEWFYDQIQKLNLNLNVIEGFDTMILREIFGLNKTKQKSKRSFNSHAVDAWVMAADVTGAEQPTERGLFYWIPIRLNRRQLHMLQPSKGGVRRPQGGTRSYGLKRGTLVEHIKYGLAYIGGMQRKIERVSLHDIDTGKRITKSAKLPDLRILTTISWRAQFLSGLKSRAPLR